MSTQRSGKYARFEYERKFLLVRPPRNLDTTQGWQIVDHYFVGTRLRLRKMISLAEGETIYKLGQKYLANPELTTTLTMTNMYLDETEYNVLVALGGNILEKTRYRYPYENRVYSIDVFGERHEGLVLAEIEAETENEMVALEPPAFALREVTDSAFFRGGYLAQLSAEVFRGEFFQFSLDFAFE
jgi:CYTH domain-containing protein